MAFDAGHSAVEQGAAAVLSCSAVVDVHVVQILGKLRRGVAAQRGDTQTRADEVDDDAPSFDRQQLAGEMADRKGLGELGEGVPW